MTTRQKLSNEDLKHLLPMCLNRDEAAWETVFHGLFGFVKYIVLKVGKGHPRDEDVDDAIADAFRNIVDSIADVAEAQNPLGYIGALARNAALARARRTSVVAGHEVAWSDSESEGDSGATEPTLASHGADQPTQGLSTMTRHIEEELDRLSKSLPEDDRRLLRLKYACDYTYDEMAYILARESGALRVNVHRLVKALRSALSEDVREAVVSDPRLMSRLGSMNLADSAPETTDERLQRLLEDYVDGDENMSAADREVVEVALLASSAFREKKVELERQLNQQELDVVGHSNEVFEMPQPMLRNLMQRALGNDNVVL
jgi:RNA polymerase sigma-70 factor (ECF subfamily)